MEVMIREYWTLHFDGLIMWIHVIERDGFRESSIELTPEAKEALRVPDSAFKSGGVE